MPKLIPERAVTLHMQNVYLWTNGLVMVFDDMGEQMPEYQGHLCMVYQRIHDVFRGEWVYASWVTGARCVVPFGYVRYKAETQRFELEKKIERFYGQYADN